MGILWDQVDTHVTASYYIYPICYSIHGLMGPHKLYHLVHCSGPTWNNKEKEGIEKIWVSGSEKEDEELDASKDDRLAGEIDNLWVSANKAESPATSIEDLWSLASDTGDQTPAVEIKNEWLLANEGEESNTVVDISSQLIMNSQLMASPSQIT